MMAMKGGLPPRPVSVHRGLMQLSKPSEFLGKDWNPEKKVRTEPHFDPKIHLQLEAPKVVRNLAFEDVAFPYEQDDGMQGGATFAYTPAPFRVLSDEGVRVLRSIVDSHKAEHLKQNERSNTMRGLSYLSDFVRDFAYNEEVIELLSKLAQQPIWPHSCAMNHAQTNVGKVGSGKAVDQWHVDAVDFVCIIIVSDTTNMKGGEVQILQMGDATGSFFDNLKVRGIPAELVESISPPAAGHCLFVRGSKLLHSVKPVEEGVEDRHSVVMSYSPRNVFTPDLTRLDPLRLQYGDPKNVADLEYARHKAWRIHGQMQYVMDHLSFGTPTEVLAEHLRKAAEELVYAHRLLLGEISDLPGVIKNEFDKVTTESFRDRSDPREEEDTAMITDSELSVN